MAPNTLLKLATILSLTILLLLFIIHTSEAVYSPDIAEGEEYLVDTQAFGSSIRTMAFSKQPKKIKKGAKCDASSPFKNICYGVAVNNGTGLLQCCKNHCRNVLGDRNNCGVCGKKCSFGQLCCKGYCVDVAYNVNNCGKCGVKCASGLKCEYGTCGYA